MAEEWVERLGAAFERGRLSIRSTPDKIANEPLAADAVVDYPAALELALRRREAERARLDGIENKIAPIIAGTIAAFALVIDKSSSWLDLLTGGLYLIPLYQLFSAFKTYEYIDTPNLENLKETWQRWPQTFLKATFLGTVDAVNKNSPTIDRKARQLNTAMKSVYIITALVLLTRIGEAAWKDFPNVRQSITSGLTSIRSTAAPASPTANARVNPRNRN